MKRHFTALIIIECSLLLAGCSGHAGKENTEETGQLPVNQAAEDDSLGMKEPEPMAGKEGPAYRWQEMPDLEVGYIPELGYHGFTRIYTNHSGAFICWKDMLIIGNNVYQRKNEIYKKTGESLQERFHISDNLDFDSTFQWNNLLIFQYDGMILDMDSGQSRTYPLDNWVYCAFQGKIYYGQNEGVFCMDLLSGEIETIYTDVSYFMVRDNGDMIISVIKETDLKVWEFWMLSYDTKGDICAKKIWETDSNECKYIEMMAFNDRGLFLLLEYWRGGEVICLNDNGEREEIMSEEGWTLKGHIIVDNGYFLWDSQILSEEEKIEILGNASWSWELEEKAETIVDSISYYDFQGNKLKTWRLIEDEMLEAGYRLVNIVYGNGEILAFYENEELDDLYINKVRPWSLPGDPAGDGLQGMESP